MAGLSFGASTPGWESTIKAMRSLPRELKSEVSRRGHTIAQPLAEEIKSTGTSQGSHAGSVARTTRPGIRGGVPIVRAGGLPYTMGSEFGGRRARKTYYSTSRLGTRYLIVARHTTMQFRPHLGQRGYWFFPTLHSSAGRDKVLDEWRDLVDDVLRGV